jgi:hypothetical protein
MSRNILGQFKSSASAPDPNTLLEDQLILDETIEAIAEYDSAIASLKERRQPLLAAIQRAAVFAGNGSSVTLVSTNGKKAVYSVPTKGTEYFDVEALRSLLDAEQNATKRAALSMALNLCLKRRAPASPSIRMKYTK